MEGPDGQPLPSVEALPSTGVESPGPRSTSYTFDDEFNGSTLSPSWGRHWGSLGLSTLSAAQATVGGGVLTITAQRSGGSWTSDLIDTFDTFRQKYGFFEARMKVPEGRGLWPAFWIADDWAHSGAEFDIAEICANPPGTNYGNDITVLHQIIHGATVYRVGAKAFRIAPLSDAWHTYGLDWRPNAVTFYFDGVATWRYTNPGLIPDVAMSPILSFELGTWCGPPDASTPSPSQMQVDWIRVQA